MSSVPTWSKSVKLQFGIATIDGMMREAHSVPYERIADGSGTARGENAEEGWIHGLDIARLCGPDVNNILYKFPHIAHAVGQLAIHENQQVFQVMVNRLAPLSSLEKHRDGPPLMSRFHLPLITNSQVEWWDEINGVIHMPIGEWRQVQYCNVLHSMSNEGYTARIHVIADLVGYDIDDN